MPSIRMGKHPRRLKFPTIECFPRSVNEFPLLSISPLILRGRRYKVFVPKTKSQENRYARSKPAPESVLRAEAVSGQRDIRLVLADVDGTLVTQRKALTDAAIDAVRQLHDSGIMFTITSGRPPRGMSMLIEPLALREAIAGFNGGVFVHPDLSVIESHTLDPATAKEALNLIQDKGLDAWVYTEADWLIRDKAAPHVAHETETVQFDAKIVASFTDAQLARAVKIVGVSDDLDLVAACEKLVQDTLGERASAARSQPYYLDVTHPHANKGTVVVTLSKLLNIPPGQIATIGDMPNDVLMFRKGGFSIAMGNASDAVKAQASAATDSNEDDGFAKAIRKFVL